MMTKDSVKNRLESGMSFTEFSYQLLQGYDFQCLYEQEGVTVQMGGSDQWGNITAGTEFVRRNLEGKAFAVTTPLLTKADGSKFGKSEAGNIWLDAELTTPFDFYQFWLRSADADIPKYLKYFSLRAKEDILADCAMVEEHLVNDNKSREVNAIKRALGEELTERVHGTDGLATALRVTNLLYGKGAADDLRALDAKTLAFLGGTLPTHTFSKEQLAAFNGEDTFGEWILEVGVAETGGSAGAIEEWSIEFCADVSSVAPERANNTATEVPPLLKNSIIKDKLNTTSANYNSGDVTYTLTALPASGRLLLYGSELAVGDEFTQADINGLGLFYENTDENAEFDDFGFVVTTPDGGYLAIDYHDIIISDDAVVSNRNVSVLDAGLSIFPNPVAGDLNVRWTADVSRDLQLELFDLNGRLLQTQTAAGASRNATVNTDKLPAGIYLLRVDGAVRRVVKR
jgi:hypothetical protein